MSPPHPGRLTQTSRPARGFAVVAAIFLIVALAALGAAMLVFSNTQQLTSAQDLQGTRAYWAARAGLEWGLNRANVSAPPACPAAFTGTIEGFAISVTCTLNVYSEAGVCRNVFRITADATSGTVGSLGYIERSVTASLERE